MAFKVVDICILGATPGGIGAAIAAARKGRRTFIVERNPFIGGMMSNGLGRTDITALEASGAIFREFASRVVQHYTDKYGADSKQVQDCAKGLLFEPHVAELVLGDMLRGEPLIEILMEVELSDTQRDGQKLIAIQLRSLTGHGVWDVHAGCFIDASYEGDLAALAGVPYSVGRESRETWNEEYAGKLYIEWFKKGVLAGSTGEGDAAVQAYNFRLCLTKEAENRVAVSLPDHYKREDYISLIDDVAAGRVQSIQHVMNIKQVPNGKTDANNHHCSLCSTDLPEENATYPEGDWEERERFITRNREYIQGLLWFIQNDEALPQTFRNETSEWGYAADEFIDNNHFPRQIYVREARRIHGEYTFTENDARLAPGSFRSPVHYDSIAVGEYPIDSHATGKRDVNSQNITLEGFLSLGWLTKIYQIPYGSIVPREVDGLLVPVAISASHMGFGTIRMEPCWMQIGFASGIAADLSLQIATSVRELSIDLLQDALLAEGQRITYISNLEWSHKAREALEYFGTKGWLERYEVSEETPITVKEASKWISQARSLPGGRSLPALPASAHVLSVGVDMGGRYPKQEISPDVYWEENRYLSRVMGMQWLAAASRALQVQIDPAAHEHDYIYQMELCDWLYRLIRARRC